MTKKVVLYKKELDAETVERIYVGMESAIVGNADYIPGAFTDDVEEIRQAFLHPAKNNVGITIQITCIMPHKKPEME